jgi:hypothetical protein
MSNLPYDELQWMERRQFEKIDWSLIDTEDYIGYILEVDLKYPKHLHNLHSNFPLAPENIEVSFNNLSPYSQNVYFDLKKKKKFKEKKLLSTLQPKYNYIIHFKNLKLYLQLGLKLTHIHRVLRFHQKKILAPFIEKCTEARKASKTKFEQDQFKKIANCCYGKTIQNVRNYSKTIFVRNLNTLKKHTASIFFKNFIIIDENLVQINLLNKKIVHDRPTFMGFTILELSKHFMYDFFYNKLLQNCPSKIDLGMSDTDSFLFKVNRKVTFKKHIKKYLDFSNYSPDHPMYSNRYKATLGYFKDELAGKYLCTEFIGLKSKCYAMNLMNINSHKTNEKKICKGLGRVAIRNRLKFKHYKKSLYKAEIKRFDFQSIRSKKQHISTVRLNKQVITHFDSKRWIYSCGIHSEPFGKHNLTYLTPCSKCKK